MDFLDILRNIPSMYPFLVLGVILVVLAALGALPLERDSAKPPRYPIRRPWRVVLLLLGVASGVFEAYRQSDRTIAPISLKKVTGGINEPNNGSLLRRRSFMATGWAKDVETDQHLWLFIEVGLSHKWPKGDELQLDRNGQWRSDVFENGIGTKCSLGLYVTNQSGHEKIREWLDIGTLIGYHPFENEIPGTRRLARVDDLQLPV